MPLMPFKKTREFTFPGYDGSSWVGAQLDPTDTTHRIEYDDGYVYVYNTDNVNIFNIYSRGTRVDTNDPTVIYNQLRIVTLEFNGVADGIDVKISFNFNIGGSVVSVPIHIVVNEIGPTLTSDFSTLARPTFTDRVDLHFIALSTDGQPVDTTAYLDFINKVIHPRVNYCLVSNSGLHIDYSLTHIYDELLGVAFSRYAYPTTAYLTVDKLNSIWYDDAKQAISISDICDYIEGYEKIPNNEMPNYWKSLAANDKGTQSSSTALVVYGPNITIAEDPSTSDIKRLLTILRERDMRLYWPIDADAGYGDVIKKIADTEYFTAKQNYFFTSRFVPVSDIPAHPFLTATVRLDDGVNMYDRGTFTPTFKEPTSPVGNYLTMCYGGNIDVFSYGAIAHLVQHVTASVVYSDFGDDTDPNKITNPFDVPWYNPPSLPVPDVVMRPYMGTIAFTYYSRKIGAFKSWWEKQRGGSWVIDVQCLEDNTLNYCTGAFDYDGNVSVSFSKYPNITAVNIFRTFEITASSTILSDGTTMQVKDTVIVDIKPYGALEMCRYAIDDVTNSELNLEFPCSNEGTDLRTGQWLSITSGYLDAIWAPIVPFNDIGGYYAESFGSGDTNHQLISDLSLTVGYKMVEPTVITPPIWVNSNLMMKRSFNFFK